MKMLLLIGFSMIFSSSLSANDYFGVEEYKEKFSEQKIKMDAFELLVRGEPRKINSKKIVKIAIIYPGKQISDYWRRSVSSFKARLDLLGINYEIKEFYTKRGQYRQQTEDIKKAIESNIDYLIFTLDAKKHKKVISRILSEGKIKIILQNITTPLKVWQGNQPLLYVGFDHQLGTKLLAEYFIKKTKGKGAYSIFFFSKGYINKMRGHSMVNFMKEYPKIELKSSFYSQGLFEKSLKGVLTLKDQINEHKFLYACSTDIALGIIAGLKKLNVKNPPLVNGWGGGEDELIAINKGELDVTVMRMNDDNGVAMAEAIKLVLQDKIKQVPTIYSGDFVLVEKGLTTQALDKLKKRAFRYSDKK